MAITLVSTVNPTVVNAGSTLTLPTGRAAGDILLLHVRTDYFSGTAAIGSVTGWTEVYSTALGWYSTQSSAHKTFWFRCTGSEGDTITLPTGSTSLRVSCHCYRGAVDSGSPIHAVSTLDQNSTTASLVWPIPALTTTIDNTMLVAWDGLETGTGGTCSASTPSGWTQVSVSLDQAQTVARSMFAGYNKTLATSGTSSQVDVTFTMPATSYRGKMSAIIALAPQTATPETIPVDVKSFTVAYGDVGVATPTNIAVATNAFATTYQDVTLNARENIAVTELSFTTTYQDVTVNAVEVIPVTEVTFSLTYGDVDAVESITVAVDVFAYTADFQELQINESFLVDAFASTLSFQPVTPLDLTAVSTIDFALSFPEMGIDETVAVDTLAFTSAFNDTNVFGNERIELEHTQFNFAFLAPQLSYWYESIKDWHGADHHDNAIGGGPQGVRGGSIGWNSGTGYLTNSDDTRSVAAAASGALTDVCALFNNFDLPVSSVFVGAQVKVEHSYTGTGGASGTSNMVLAQFYAPSTIDASPNSQSFSFNRLDTDGTDTFGSAADTWGWTGIDRPSVYNLYVLFGYGITTSDATPRVDQVQMKLWYAAQDGVEIVPTDIITVDTTAFNVDYQSLGANELVKVDTKPFVLTAQNIAVGNFLGVDTQSATLTFNDVTTVDRVRVDTKAFALTRNNVSVNQGVSVESGSFTLTTNDVQVADVNRVDTLNVVFEGQLTNSIQVVEVDTTTFTTTLNDVSIIIHMLVEVDTKAFALTYETIDVIANMPEVILVDPASFTQSTGTITLDGWNVTASGPVSSAATSVGSSTVRGTATLGWTTPFGSVNTSNNIYATCDASTLDVPTTIRDIYIQLSGLPVIPSDAHIAAVSAYVEHKRVIDNSPATYSGTTTVALVASSASLLYDNQVAFSFNSVGSDTTGTYNFSPFTTPTSGVYLTGADLNVANLGIILGKGLSLAYTTLYIDYASISASYYEKYVNTFVGQNLIYVNNTTEFEVAFRGGIKLNETIHVEAESFTFVGAETNVITIVDAGVEEFILTLNNVTPLDTIRVNTLALNLGSDQVALPGTEFLDVATFSLTFQDVAPNVGVSQSDPLEIVFDGDHFVQVDEWLPEAGTSFNVSFGPVLVGTTNVIAVDTRKYELNSIVTLISFEADGTLLSSTYVPYALSNLDSGGYDWTFYTQQELIAPDSYFASHTLGSSLSTTGRLFASDFRISLPGYTMPVSFDATIRHQAEMATGTLLDAASDFTIPDTSVAESFTFVKYGSYTVSNLTGVALLDTDGDMLHQPDLETTAFGVVLGGGVTVTGVTGSVQMKLDLLSLTVYYRIPDITIIVGSTEFKTTFNDVRAHNDTRIIPDTMQVELQLLDKFVKVGEGVTVNVTSRLGTFTSGEHRIYLPINVDTKAFDLVEQSVAVVDVVPATTHEFTFTGQDHLIWVDPTKVTPRIFVWGLG